MTATRTGTHEPAAARGRLTERERLTERLVLMQSELGGLFYEMAIRDHLQLDLLIERAAAMQRLEAELRALDEQLENRAEPDLA